MARTTTRRTATATPRTTRLTKRKKTPCFLGNVAKSVRRTTRPNSWSNRRADLKARRRPRKAKRNPPVDRPDHAPGRTHRLKSPRKGLEAAIGAASGDVIVQGPEHVRGRQEETGTAATTITAMTKTIEASGTEDIVVPGLALSRRGDIERLTATAHDQGPLRGDYSKNQIDFINANL